jgi:selenoprotein W-related protein
LIKLYEPEIETITLIPSDGGKFEIEVNGALLYSKLETKRHAEPGEVAQLIAKYMERGRNG